MSTFYVCVDGIPEVELNFIGYFKVDENDEFERWEDYHGKEYILDKKGSRYFYVEDINDAAWLKARAIRVVG